MIRSLMSRLSHLPASIRRHGGPRPMARAIWRFAREEGWRAFWRRYSQPLEQEPAAPAQQPEPTRSTPVRTRSPDWLEQPPGVLLIGHPYLISGRGEDIRTAAAALAVNAVPFHLRNTFGGGLENRSKLQNFKYFDHLSNEHPQRANLFLLNADEMVPGRNHLGESLFANGYNIGYWAWELSQFPDAWRPALELVDEVWAPSRFIQQAVAEQTSRPVIRMPLAVEPEPSPLARCHFGLPERSFLFLFFFDFSSFIARKNPWAVIEAFSRAFGPEKRDDIGLVIKLNGADLRPDDYQAFLQHEAIRQPGVWLVDQVLSDPEIRGLMHCCDAFVSLHRSEGFGRGPAEAMYFGKPVIVTGYSGNLDFCNELNACVVDHTLIPVNEGEYPFGEGQLWADADVEQASWFMRRLVEDPDYGKGIGSRGAETIRTFNSSAAVGRRYAARLAALDLI